MADLDQYRRLAAKLMTMAEGERNDDLKAGWEGLARGYARLAERVEVDEEVQSTGTAPP